MYVFVCRFQKSWQKYDIKTSEKKSSFHAITMMINSCTIIKITILNLSSSLLVQAVRMWWVENVLFKKLVETVYRANREIRENQAPSYHTIAQ